MKLIGSRIYRIRNGEILFVNKSSIMKDVFTISAVIKGRLVKDGPMLFYDNGRRSTLGTSEWDIVETPNHLQIMEARDADFFD
jgi:hypothetical protein